MNSEIPLIPSIPQVLREAAQVGRLIPFVGAGASVLGGCPNWTQLADGALKACINAEKFNHGQYEQIRHLTPRMRLCIARAIEAEHNLRIDYAKLIQPEDHSNNVSGQRIYRSLGKLGQTFVTTNYDAWLDTEIPDLKLSVAPSGQEMTATTPRTRRRIIDVNEFTPANLNQPNCVFHLHGSVADPGGMIMTTRDYIIRRIALHTVSEHFEVLRAGFERAISPQLFTSGHRHELYRLLSKHFDELSPEGKAAVIDAIRSLPLPATGEDRERRLKYTQRDWLSSIKSYPEGAEWFAEFAGDRELGPLSEHPDFLSYHETRAGPGPTPFTADSLVAFAEDGSLIERLNGFTETNSWKGPTLGGLVSALEGAVASHPKIFLSLLGVFHGAKAPFQHALIQGFRNVFNLPKDKQPDFDWNGAWPKLMAFFTECIADPQTWVMVEEREQIDLVPTHDWMRSLIAGFLESATRDDETAYPKALLPQGLSIIRILLDRAPESEPSLKDPMTHALNTEKGHAVGALYNHALRACRLAKDRENSPEPGWASVKAVFDAEIAKCRNANYEFSTLTASYIANLEFMSYQWLVDNVGALFPSDQFPNNFIVAIGGLAYAAPSRRSYQLLASNRVFDRALSVNLEDRHGRDRVVEWISLAYLWDDEELDSPIIQKIFASGPSDLETMAEFFWSVRGDKLTDKQRQKVLEFWDRCLTWGQSQTRTPEQLIARLSRLSPYLETLNDDGKRLLLAVVPYVHNDYATDQMVEEIARLADSNPPAAAGILERMLEASAPTYDLDDKLKKLIEKLADLGLRDAAIRCAEKVRKTLPGMLDLYKGLLATNERRDGLSGMMDHDDGSRSK